MRSRRISSIITLALSVGIAAGAVAQTEPFADVNNDGVYNAGDVLVGALVNNDGQFSTAKAEGSWVPRDGKVGIVVPGKFVGKKRAVVLKASGDVVVHGAISVPGKGGAVVLLSTEGAVRVDPSVRIQADTIVQLVAMQDVEVGNGVELRGKANDFSMVSLASQAGCVKVGKNVGLGAAGLVELATGEATGGSVTVGSGCRLASGAGSVRITAGDNVAIDGARVAARDVLVGSHASSALGRAAGKGPGLVTMRSSQVKSAHGRVRVFADGPGGTIDMTKASVQAASQADVVLEADIVVR